MRIIADFHIHSKYSRATSRDMDIPHIAQWAKWKGIDIVGTGDFTHPLWMHELKQYLSPAGCGLYEHDGVKFILTAEVCNIFNYKGASKRVHNMIIAPSLEVADEINKELGYIGNLSADGRPMLGFTAKELVKITLDKSPDCLIVPAHCLLGDTRIHLNQGIKKIRDIVKNDIVYTHKGNLKKVTATLKRHYKGRALRIQPYYFRIGLETTPEHPFYIIRTYKNCPSRMSICTKDCAQLKKSCARRYFEKYCPQWVNAANVEKGDVMLFPRFTNRTKDVIGIRLKNIINTDDLRSFGRIIKIHDAMRVDEDFCRLAGYFVSEGYTNSRDCISFCFHRHEQNYINEVRGLMKKLFGIDNCKEAVREGVDGVELIFYSKVLMRFFSKLFYIDNNEKRANNKCLPGWMLTLPQRKQKEIIRGWWRGDKGYTSSRALMNQMKVIFLRLGIIPSIGIDSVREHGKRGRHKLGYREIFAKHDNFAFTNLSFFKDEFDLLKDACFKRYRTKVKRRHGWIDDKYIYIPVRKVSERKYEGEVFNIEVEGDNSYLAEFATVHNCWTPWFGIFGANSGFDSIQECFQEEAKNIYAIETGLSSDPAMNWRLSALDKITLVSNSDAHSPAKLGREANVFDCKMDYKEIIKALKTQDNRRLLYTLEFFPEEGKYHWDGHRNCGVRQSPQETKKNDYKCPKCGRPVTVGVMHRVDKLADRKEGFTPEGRPAFKSVIPLIEIIAEVRGRGAQTAAVENEYKCLIQRFKREFNILIDMPEGEIREAMDAKIAEAIIRVRQGRVNIEPGHDGEYGTVKIFKENEEPPVTERQLELF